MNLYSYGYHYVCSALLKPVVNLAHWRGDDVTYRNTWTTPQSDLPDWEAWLNGGAPDRVFLLTCDIHTGDHAMGVARVKQCQREGIPTVSIMHGCPPHPLKAAADTVCVWGEFYRDYFPHNQTVVTGNPALDNAPTRERAHYLLAEKGYKTPYALFAGSLRNHYTNPALFEDAIRAVAGRMPIIVSPHPNPEEERYLPFFRRLMDDLPNVRLWQAGPEWLRALVSGADLVFGRSSVLIEAAAQGVPALAIRDHPDPYADGQIYVEWAGAESVSRALAGRPSAAFTQRHAYALSGAAERVYRTIREAATGRLPLIMGVDYAAV